MYENKYSQFDRLPAYENFRKQTEYSSITLSENKSTGTQNKKSYFYNNATSKHNFEYPKR